MMQPSAGSAADADGGGGGGGGPAHCEPCLAGLLIHSYTHTVHGHLVKQRTCCPPGVNAYIW